MNISDFGGEPQNGASFMSYHSNDELVYDLARALRVLNSGSSELQLPSGDRICSSAQMRDAEDSYLLEIETDPVALRPLYERLPGTFPALFEKLVLTHRWNCIDAQVCRLLPNKTNHGTLAPLEHAIFEDAPLVEVLNGSRLVQFARGPGLDYDPICFDCNAMAGKRDCPVVKVDHEMILCNDQVVVVERVAPTFREFALLLIRKAAGYS